jgi:holo-[acyl-carrier protein] synthase
MADRGPAQAVDATATVDAIAAVGAPVRVGVDVTAVAEVADAVAIFGDRYLHRLFTPHEVESCGGAAAAASLAARFAAKEAVVKVLEPSGARPPWRDIEVVRRPDGACRIRLHRTAASLAAEHGVGPISVSLSHEAGLAVAVVAAACEGPADGPRQRSTEQSNTGGADR